MSVNPNNNLNRINNSYNNTANKLINHNDLVIPAFKGLNRKAIRQKIDNDWKEINNAYKSLTKLKIEYANKKLAIDSNQNEKTTSKLSFNDTPTIHMIPSREDMKREAEAEKKENEALQVFLNNISTKPEQEPNLINKQ